MTAKDREREREREGREMASGGCWLNCSATPPFQAILIIHSAVGFKDIILRRSADTLDARIGLKPSPSPPSLPN